MFYRVLFLSIIIALSGCTSKLWKTPGYTEEVTGFFGVKDKDILIVTGQKYKYVFETDDQFKTVLAASSSIELKPEYREFKLDEDNNVTGYLRLVSYHPTDKQKLSELGFVEGKYGDTQINFQLKGKRYQVEGELPFEKHDNGYFVWVETPESGIAKVGKIVATPATLTFDSIVVISTVIVFVIPWILHSRYQVQTI